MGPHRLIREEASGNIELYDEVVDPGDLQDNANVLPRISEDLEAILGRLISDGRTHRDQAPLAPFTDEQLQQLRHLGYIE
jgi:hypothetical protein